MGETTSKGTSEHAFAVVTQVMGDWSQKSAGRLS